MALDLSNLESPSPDGALCRIWLKVVLEIDENDNEDDDANNRQWANFDQERSHKAKGKNPFQKGDNYDTLKIGCVS